MAATVLAYSVSAGAMTLALATTFLAWRTRKTLGAQNQTYREQLAEKATLLGELDTATAAFDEAFLAIEDNTVRLVWGEDTLIECAKALGLKTATDAACAPKLFALLMDSSPEAKTQLNELMREGKACRFELFAENNNGLPIEGVSGLSLVVEGKSSGATAWIRLAITGQKPSLSSGPFAQLADHLPTPAVIAAKDGRLVWANQAYVSAVEATNLEAVIHSNLSLDQGLDALIAESREKRLRTEAFRWIPIAGHRRAFTMIAEPLSEAYTCAYLLDITESEDSREALKRHAKAHDETLNALEDAVAIFGPERQLQFHNTAFEKLWELEPAWLADRPSHGEWLDRLRQKRRLPETSDYAAFKARELEFYGITQTAPDEMWSLPDGRALRIVRQPHPLGGMVLAFSDKTGELDLKSQFNALIQVQKATLDQLGEAVSVYGANGRMRLRNQAFDKFWGIAADTLPDVIDFSAVADLCLPKVPDRGFWADLKGRITDTDPVSRAPQKGEVSLLDGRLAQWRTQPLPDGATLLVFSDITATRALEKAIQARDEALEESTRLKREFVANVSYELRTPLTTIVGYSDLLQKQAVVSDERHQGYIDAIQTAAKELARSIDDVLDMAQIDAGEMDISRTDLSVKELRDAVAQEVEDIIKLRHLKLTFKGMSDQSLIHADARRVKQITAHLAEYAARQANAGTDIVVETARDKDDLVLNVAYLGRGIPYHTQAHIFDRFVGRERGGPGLALALVKALVELHDGLITLQSEPSTGAQFTVRLPRQGEIKTTPSKEAGSDSDDPFELLNTPLKARAGV